MADRLEARFGEAAVGTSYVIIGSAVPADTKHNVLINVAGRLAANLRLYIADNSWSSGEPTGGTLKVAIAYDWPIPIGDVVQLSGIMLEEGDKLIARASVGASLDVSAHGVAITGYP